MLEDSQAVREHRQRALPYTSALEDIRYEAPEVEDQPRPARRRKVAIEGGSSSSAATSAAGNWPPRAPRDRTSNQVGQSSSSEVAVPSYGAMREGVAGKLKNPLRITREDVEGVMDRLSAVRDFGFGVGGVGY